MRRSGSSIVGCRRPRRRGIDVAHSVDPPPSGTRARKRRSPLHRSRARWLKRRARPPFIERSRSATELPHHRVHGGRRRVFEHSRHPALSEDAGASDAAPRHALDAAHSSERSHASTDVSISARMRSVQPA